MNKLQRRAEYIIVESFISEKKEEEIFEEGFLKQVFLLEIERGDNLWKRVFFGYKTSSVRYHSKALIKPDQIAYLDF